MLKTGQLAVGNYNYPSNSSFAMQRPNDTTAYAVNDIIGPTTSASYAGNPLADVFSDQYAFGYITSAYLHCEDPACLAQIRAHIIGVDSVLLNQDNAPFNANPSITNARYYGYLEFAALAPLGASAAGNYAQLMDIRHYVRRNENDTNSLYFVLQTLTAFTPVAESIFTLNINTDVLRFRQ